MKRFPFRFVRVVAILAVVACADRSFGEPSAEPTAGRVLRVGTSGDYPPFSDGPMPEEGAELRDLPSADVWPLETPAPRKRANIAAAPPITGFDIDVARAFAKEHGYKFEFIRFRWPELSQLLERGGVDLVMSGVTWRLDRGAGVISSRPYLVTGAVAVAGGANAGRMGNLDWLNAETTRLAVNQGGYLESLARRSFPHAQVMTVPDNRLLKALLLTGKADAAIAERYEAASWEANGLQASKPFSRDLKAYIAPAASAELVGKLNVWLAAREADGWLNDLRLRWMGASAKLREAEVCQEAISVVLRSRSYWMPRVAALKHMQGMPIEDQAQEMRVLQRARDEAAKHGLSPDGVASLFRLLIEAAKRNQREALLRRDDSGAARGGSLPQVREAIARSSDQLIAELGRCRRHLKKIAAAPLGDPAIPTDLDTRMRRVMEELGSGASQ